MFTDTLAKEDSASTKLDVVSKKAKRQIPVRLHKTSRPSDKQLSAGIKSLKHKSSNYETEADPDISLIERAWDWFQRAIGNR